jgi:hypothetical protein
MEGPEEVRPADGDPVFSQSEPTGQGIPAATESESLIGDTSTTAPGGLAGDAVSTVSDLSEADA